MIVTKAIKPAKLKDEAMRLALLNAMRECGRDIQKDFEKTTATWKHKPKFESLISLTGPGPVVVVGTNDEIYGYVNEGTREHIIEAKPGHVLAFPSAFTPKTSPGVLGSSAGSSGGETVFTPYVLHPGTKARDFDKAIQKLWESKFKTRMEQAMKDAAKASGHEI